ncbi:hypothetical protein Tco_1212739 [Tanacetum coccineum]
MKVVGIRKIQKSGFRIVELSVTILFRITVEAFVFEVLDLRFRNLEIRNMSIANQQTLAESRAENIPPILEKGSYVPWASQFLRFLDCKRGEGELMRKSIDSGPYIRKEIVDLNNAIKIILKSIKVVSAKPRSILCRYHGDELQSLRNTQ